MPIHRSKNVAMVAEMATRGLTGRQLAKATGLSKNTISELVNNRRTPSRDTARKIARALKVTPAKIGFSREGGR